MAVQKRGRSKQTGKFLTRGTAWSECASPCLVALWRSHGLGTVKGNKTFYSKQTAVSSPTLSAK